MPDLMQFLSAKLPTNHRETPMKEGSTHTFTLLADQELVFFTAELSTIADFATR